MTPVPTLALSFVAGVLSFLSPCIVPLVPSYISFVGGAAATDPVDARGRGVVVLRTALFVLGFTAVFVALGVLLSGSAALFRTTGTIINIAAGSIVIVLGLNIILDFWKALNVERRLRFEKRPAGHVGSLLIGMAFGAGWTPCVGPILASVLILAGTSGSIGTAVLYLTAFSMGLGLPFLLVSVFLGHATALLDRVRRFIPAIRIASGLLLVGIGILIAFGRLQQLPAQVIAWGWRLAAWDEAYPVASSLIFGAAAAVIGLVPIGLVLRARRGAATTVLAGAFGTAALALAVLNATGAINLASWLATWLRYTGL